MFQPSRRRFMAGATFIGFGSLFGATRLAAQAVTSIRCETQIANKTVTGLKPTTLKAGVFQNVTAGRMNTDPATFGHRTEIKIPGTVKLGKGISPSANNSATLGIIYSRADKGRVEDWTENGDSLTLEIYFPQVMLGNLYPSDLARLTVVVPGLNGNKTPPTLLANPNGYSKSAWPSARLSIYGPILKNLPKSSDFSGKLMLDGKPVAEVKMPKVALAKIVDALDKEQGANATKIASNPALSGDLASAILPAGCEITKASAGGGSSGCYLTTATVNVVGLEDDCWELRQLRAFRNRFAKNSSHAASMMADYYAHAPSVVDRINAKPNARRIWLDAYWRSIVPAALASQLRLDAIAARIYVSGSRKLQRIAAT